MTQPVSRVSPAEHACAACSGFATYRPQKPSIKGRRVANGQPPSPGGSLIPIIINIWHGGIHGMFHTAGGQLTRSGNSCGPGTWGMWETRRFQGGQTTSSALLWSPSRSLLSLPVSFTFHHYIRLATVKKKPHMKSNCCLNPSLLKTLKQSNKCSTHKSDV